MLSHFNDYRPDNLSRSLQCQINVPKHALTLSKSWKTKNCAKKIVKVSLTDVMRAVRLKDGIS